MELFKGKKNTLLSLAESTVKLRAQSCTFIRNNEGSKEYLCSPPECVY